MTSSYRMAYSAASNPVTGKPRRYVFASSGHVAAEGSWRFAEVRVLDPHNPLDRAADHGKIPGIKLARSPGEVTVGDSVCVDEECPLPAHTGMCPDYTNPEDVAALWKAEAQRCRKLVGAMAEHARQLDNTIKSVFLDSSNALNVKNAADLERLVLSGVLTRDEVRALLGLPALP